MFVLQLPISAHVVEQLKLNLARSIPHVKSSHRVEALGRGLGFRTYASLLAASRLREPPVATARALGFVEYLCEHGFQVDGRNLYRAAAQVAISRVLDTVPKLHKYGIGFGRLQRNADGSRQTMQQQYDEFLRHRKECLSEYSSEEFLRSLAFLSRVVPTRTIRKGTGSYRLKHIAENYRCTYPEGDKLGPDYVPNGLLIAAAIHAGFKYKTYVDDLGYDIPNVSFNMSKAIVDDLDEEIRPGYGFAQDRKRKRERREESAETKRRFAEIRRSLRAQA